MSYRLIVGCVTTVLAVGASSGWTTAQAGSVPEVTSSQESSATRVAREVDRLIDQELRAAQVTPASRCRDEDYLRRVSFDVAGVPPTPGRVTLFGLSDQSSKRAAVVEELLASPEFGRNWATYYRDVVFLAATNARGRFAASVFEDWLADQFNADRPWNEVVTDMLTATGNVAEEGSTGFVFAHSGDAAEVAAEASRIFLGIQIQCANCHDHPSDQWKREQFHELAAYFPRIGVRPVLVDGRQRGFEVVSVNQTRRPPGEMLRENPERMFAALDRNRDQKLTKEEVNNSPRQGQLQQVFDRILEYGDTNNDNAISLEEIRKLEVPQGPGPKSTEYTMSDLKDPTSPGQLVHPRFFVDGSKPGERLTDIDRRRAAAAAITARTNPWFSRAIVNRVWNELLGSGFYQPVDDLGPTREAVHPAALDALARGFVENNHSLKWLVRTITQTQAYQREIRPVTVSSDSVAFAAQIPTRLRPDQVYFALVQVLGLREPMSPRMGMMGDGAAMYARERGPRSQVSQIFSVDPSTPHEDVTGNVQQALFLMNTPQLRSAISASGSTRLASLLRDHSDNSDAVAEVYLLTLSREPSDAELKACQTYLAESPSRGEGFEDLLWTLLNSSEFLSRR